MTTEIHGYCAKGFERVHDALAEAFDRGQEIGASVAVDVGGENVVDLWAGHADSEKTRPWLKDTIANVYSTTKGVVAVLALRLVEEGRLDLDAPVTKYWPEFAQAGKEKVTTRQLLSHRGGLPAVRHLMAPGDLFDWDTMTAALAAETPWWEPGTAHGYHAVTYGWLVGEVIRRIAGKSVGAVLKDELAGPLGLDFAIGIPQADDARCAGMKAPLPIAPEGEPSLLAILMNDPTSVTAMAFINPPSLMMPDTVNSRPWRAAEIPGANGHGTARALARLYGAIANGGDAGGVHVLSPEVARQAAVEHSFGPDLVLQLSTRIGLGFMLSQPGNAFGPNEGAFGHPGAGGSVAFADPVARVGFSYVMNRMGPYILIDPRAKALMAATYGCLGG